MTDVDMLRDCAVQAGVALSGLGAALSEIEVHPAGEVEFARSRRFAGLWNVSGAAGPRTEAQADLTARMTGIQLAIEMLEKDGTMQDVTDRVSYVRDKADDLNQVVGPAVDVLADESAQVVRALDAHIASLRSELEAAERAARTFRDQSAAAVWQGQTAVQLLEAVETRARDFG